MIDLGQNCKTCRCATCIHLPYCEVMCGNTMEHCQTGCIGVNSMTGGCSQYEKERN